jgi:hypothetical protein
VIADAVGTEAENECKNHQEADVGMSPRQCNHDFRAGYGSEEKHSDTEISRPPALQHCIG